MIDDFEAPSPRRGYLNVEFNSPMTVLNKVVATEDNQQILGGQREVFLETDDAAEVLSGGITVGGARGNLLLETNHMTRWYARLEYDGDELGVNAMTGTDLREGRLDRFLRLAFPYMDPGTHGSFRTPMSLQINVSGANGQASVETALPYNPNPFKLDIRFSDFGNGDVTVFDSVDSLEFIFNRPSFPGLDPAYAWDFGLEKITVEEIPEPSTLMMLGCGLLLGISGAYLRRKRRR